MVQGWKPDRLRCFRTTLLTSKQPGFHKRTAQFARLPTIIAWITVDLRSGTSAREEHLHFFCGLDAPKQFFFLLLSLLYLSLVKRGHEMLRNNGKATQGGTHKKQTGPVWKRRDVHSSNRKVCGGAPARGVCWRSACSCWGSVAHGAGNTRCHISGVT